MKTLKVILSLLIISMVMTACQKDSLLENELDFKSPNVEKVQKKKHPVPFHAEFTSSPYSSAENEEVCGAPSPVFNLLQSGAGNATHMGNIEAHISSCINPGPPPSLYNVVFTLTAANGDELILEGDATGATITGGTGRFEYATGSVTGYWEPIGPGLFMNYLDGEIQY